MWLCLTYLSSNFSINYCLRQQTWALLRHMLIVITKSQNLLMSSFHIRNLTVAPSPASVCWLLFVPCQASFFKGLLGKELYRMSFGDRRNLYQPESARIKGAEPNPPKHFTCVRHDSVSPLPLQCFTLSSLFLFSGKVPPRLFVVNIALDAVEV